LPLAVSIRGDVTFVDAVIVTNVAAPALVMFHDVLDSVPVSDSAPDTDVVPPTGAMVKLPLAVLMVGTVTALATVTPLLLKLARNTPPVVTANVSAADQYSPVLVSLSAAMLGADALPLAASNSPVTSASPMICTVPPK
jgi:hypothetical protein